MAIALPLDHRTRSSKQLPPRPLLVILIAIFSCGVYKVDAQQSTPGTYADSHNPAGAPDPGKETQIWKVDPLTGSVSITIPFLNVKQSGRGPFYPYSLQYNSSATYSLSSNIIPPVQPGSGGSPTNEYGFQNYQWLPANNIGNAVAPPTATTPAPWTEIGSPTLHYSVSALSISTGSNPYTGQGETTGCEIFGPAILNDNEGSHDLDLVIINVSGTPQGQCISINTSPSSTSDGSTLLTSWPGPAIAVYPNGTKFYGDYAPGSSTPAIEDSNGNYLTSSGTGLSGTVSDSLGRPLYTVTEGTIESHGPNLSFDYPMSIATYTTGTPASYTLTWGYVPFNFILPQPTSSNVTDGGGNYPGLVTPGPGSGSVGVLQAISLPDKTSYTFAYDPIYGVI